MSQIQSRAQEMMHKSTVDLIIIDYVDLIHTEGTQRRYESNGRDFREISHSLKSMARELTITVVALAQVSRKVTMHSVDLKVTKDQGIYIENDADLVIYLYREDMHEQWTERLNIIDLIVTKHRNGPFGVISLYFQPQTGRIRDFTKNHQQKQLNIERHNSDDLGTKANHAD
jgi:replicative DNA helicase